MAAKSFWKIEIEVRKELVEALQTLADEKHVSVPTLISTALDEFLNRNGVSTIPEDPELSDQITIFARDAKVGRDKFIADLIEYSEEKFRGEYPLLASGPTVVARLRNYVRGGGR